MKKSTVRLMSALLCMVMILTMLPLRAEAATPVISQKSLTIGIGTKATLKVKNTTKTPKWSSSKKSVATVNSKGVVTAKKFGYATITAKIGSKSYKCKVYVSGNPTLELSAMTLIKGKSRNITLFGATAKSFSSSNPKVVKITSKKGNACTVKALKKGTATITVKDKEDRKYQCTVTVISNGNSGASSFTGGNISLDNIGISVPTLDKFNGAGLKENDNWWGGSVDTMQTIADNANAIMGATGYGTANSSGNGFTITEYYIEWAYAGYSAVNDISLHRDTDNGYYVLEINTPLDVNYSGAAGGGDIAPISRDIVKFMLSCISSNPKTLYDYLYNGIYNDASTLNCSVYQKVGDCKVLLDENFQVTNGFHLKFYIKPAN